MKPLNFCLRILIPCAAAVPAVVMALAPDEIQVGSIDTLVAALPAPSSDRIWVKVRESISVEELSGSLKVDEERLAKLNDVDEDHSFLRGDWLVLPSQQARQIKHLASIDTSDLRRSPPLHSLPPVQEGAAVRFGDTLAKIAHRYGLTLHELLRLNPGLETARLVVGSQVRLAGSTTGGVTWPELQGFDKPKLSSRPPTQFDASLDSLVRYGVVSADERDRIQGMSKSLIGVSCTSLMVNRKPANNGWSKWGRPAAGSLDEQLVIDRCAAPTRLATP